MPFITSTYYEISTVHDALHWAPYIDYPTKKRTGRRIDEQTCERLGRTWHRPKLRSPQGRPEQLAPSYWRSVISKCNSWLDAQRHIGASRCGVPMRMNTRWVTKLALPVYKGDSGLHHCLNRVKRQVFLVTCTYRSSPNRPAVLFARLPCFSKLYEEHIPQIRVQLSLRCSLRLLNL